MNYRRNLWIKALTAHKEQVINNLAEDLAQNWQVNYLTIPQAGLSLLTLEDGIFQQPYYLGEVPIANAGIELIDETGQSFTGAAQVMGDSADFAVALAVCDAVMAHQLTGWERVAELIERGMKKRSLEDLQRGAMLAKTKVNFSLLAQEESDAED
ncbi:MAG: phosphonate C-P lyase system protein PhnG [Pleurocapsa sp.]